jgi:hypothetical protein
MKSVAESQQTTVNDDAELTASRITTDRVLKLTSCLLEGVIRVTAGFARNDESRFLQILYYAFPDACLHAVEADPDAEQERLETDCEPPAGQFEDEEGLAAFDEAVLLGSEQEQVIHGRMDADEARAFVEMLSELLDAIANGDRSLSVKSLAAVHALRCQLLAPQGETANEHQSADTIVFSRWLIEEIDEFTGERGMSRVLRDAFPGLASAAPADGQGDDLLLGEMSREERDEMMTALNDTLDAPGMEHSESGCVIEAAVCLLF